MSSIATSGAHPREARAAVRRPPPSDRMLRRQALVICFACSVVSLSLGYFALFRGGHWHAVLEYDDGVYFGTAVRLAHGSVPYRDYVFAHPPGVTLLLAPLGLLSRLTGTRFAFELARLATPLVQAAGVFSAGWLVRHRRGASALAGLMTAVLGDSLWTERTVMLEPYCVLGCLLALIVLFEGDSLTESGRRLFWAGGLFGLAASFELFAAFPFLVMVVALALSARRRRAVTLVAGASVGFAAVTAPFAFMDPGSFVRDVFTAQLSRTQVVLPSFWDRLLHLLGFPEATSYSTPVRVLIVLLTLTTVTAVAVAAVLRSRRSAGLSPIDRWVAGAMLASAFFLLLPPAFYYHYAAFFAPFLALTVALAVARLELRLVAAVTACVLVAGTGHAIHLTQSYLGAHPARTSVIEAVVPRRACVLSDEPAYLLLANRFFAGASCSSVLDTYATSFVQDGGTVRPGGPASDRYWISQFEKAQYLELNQGFSLSRIPWDPVLVGYVKSHFGLLWPKPMIYVSKVVADG